jgi:hypothetical protein
MKSKNLISLTIAFCFIVMSISGLLLYFGQKQWHPVETLHILFGVIFLGFAIFHVLNNWSSIKGYAKNRKENKWQKELMVAASIFGIFLIGGSLEVPPFMQMAHGFKKLFGAKREQKEMLAFALTKTNQEQTEGKPISIILEKNKAVEAPTIAIWVEDSTHNFVENLFVPTETIVLGEEKSTEPIGKRIAEGEVKKTPFKPEALPTFQQKATNKTPNFVGFTPTENFILSSKTNLKGSGFIMLEIRNGNTLETYQTAISTQKNNVSALVSEKNTLFNRAIVEMSR